MRQVGQYHIDRAISTGGMSTIWLGRHREMGRQVVVKQLHPQLAQDSALVKRFEREAKILGGLHHQHIVDILDYFEHQGSSYIVLEYIEGCSLKELLERRRPVPTVVAACIAGQVAQGLGYAHRQGIVHRDIKPANVMFTTSGVTKITDFGLAFAKEALSITDPGTFFGTPAYLAPEQIRGHKGDDRSDLFALGVILYEMLAGTNPFAGEGPSQSIDRILRHAPQRLSQLNPEVPPGIDELVGRLLEKEPDRRMQNAGEVAAALEPYQFITSESLSRFLDDPSGFQPRQDDQASLARLVKQERRDLALKRLLAGAAVAIVAAALAFTTYRWIGAELEHWRVRNAGRMAATAPDTAAARPATDTARPAVQRLRLSGTTGAKVYLNGKYRGSVPFSQEGIGPGTYLVRAELEGYQTQERTATVKAGQDLELAFDMELLALAPGYLKVTVSPWAEVYVDGRFIDRTPLPAPLQLAAGRHELVLRHPNRKQYTQTLTIGPSDTTALSVAMPEAFGFLKLAVLPWADVYLDGERAGTTPLGAALRLSIGEHELKLSGPGGKEWKETIRIKEGQTIERQITLQ